MHDQDRKYLISARLEAHGVIQRSDVVGAIFGQTEGLLGEQLDLRTLQESDRVGRLEVDVGSEDGKSYGLVTLQTNLDRVETAIIAAAFETIEQVGPCRATLTVEQIEDVRAAKRQDVVDRARELLATGFEDSGLSSREVIEAVRSQDTISDITTYEGYPAGPAVHTSESVILVEGRADVRRLLEYGIDNAIGVEGTDVPDTIIDLTNNRTVTAFFDGDRGGNLLLLELAQLGDIDYVTFAPPGTAVEGLSNADVHMALQERVPYEQVNPTDGEEEEVGDSQVVAVDAGTIEPRDTTASRQLEGEGHIDDSDTDRDPATRLRAHVSAVTDNGAVICAIDDEYSVIETTETEEISTFLDALNQVPHALIVGDVITQAMVDTTARYGVDHLIGTGLGEFTKRPVDVRLHTTDQLLSNVETVPSS